MGGVLVGGGGMGVGGVLVGGGGTGIVVLQTRALSWLLSEEHAALIRVTMFASFGKALFVPKREAPVACETNKNENEGTSKMYDFPSRR